MLLSLTAFFAVNSGLSVIYNFLTKGSKGERFCIIYIIELSMLSLNPKVANSLCSKISGILA